MEEGVALNGYGGRKVECGYRYTHTDLSHRHPEGMF